MDMTSITRGCEKYRSAEHLELIFTFFLRHRSMSGIADSLFLNNTAIEVEACSETVRAIRLTRCSYCPSIESSYRRTGGMPMDLRTGFMCFSCRSVFCWMNASARFTISGVER